MFNEHSIYIALLCGSLFFPFLFSFDKKVGFYKKWPQLAPAVLVPMLFFIPWDVFFTNQGVWWFNDEFIVGVRFLGLPIEEWLFFFVIPYCGVFVYEVLKAYFPKLDFNRSLKFLFYGLSLIFFILAIFQYGRWYSSFNLLFNAVFILIALNVDGFQRHLTHFFFTFLLTFFPMLVVNGVLTSMPVVEYSSEHISQFRLYTIPVEDFAYYLLLLLMSVSVFEYANLRAEKSVK